MPGDDEAGRWYVRSRGRVQGPLSLDQLRALRDRGQLARFDQVSSDRQAWVAADTLEDLFPRRASGGAFVAAKGTKRPSRPGGPETASDGFLVIGDDHADHPIDLDGPEPVPDEPAGWYYADTGTPRGPVEYAELKRLARDGRISSGTLYWRSGLDQWTPGADLPELGRLWRFESDREQHPGPSSPTTEGPRDGEGAPATILSLAVASLALNLICGVGNLAAIVAGVMALRRIARSGGSRRGKGLAIAGVATGIVGLIALIWLACPVLRPADP